MEREPDDDFELECEDEGSQCEDEGATSDDEPSLGSLDHGHIPIKSGGLWATVATSSKILPNPALVDVDGLLEQVDYGGWQGPRTGMG